jgi:hypothetical protein
MLSLSEFMKQRPRASAATTLVFAAFALTALLPATDGVAASGSVPSTADPGRPVIIVVHGRGELPGDSVAVRSRWSRVLRAGVSELAGAPLIRDGDVRIAWYADALDPLAPALCDADPALPARRAGARRGVEMEPLFTAMGEGLAAALDLFDGYARDEARAVAGDLLFLGDSLRRCAAETQLARALARAERERRPVILVAHSFGSLLAYDYLRSVSPDDTSEQSIQRFVTIGSLLGAPGARELLLGDTTTRASVPPGVRAWTNILDARDVLASSIAFADADAARVENLTTTPGVGGDDPHDVVRYLRDPVTVRTVVSGWCAAIDAAAPERPAEACGRISSLR